MEIVFSKKCLEYESLGHPEFPLRVKTSYEYLKEKGFGFLEPEPCKEDDLLLVHNKGLIEQVKNLDFFDADTPALSGIFERVLI